jgi:hypothetical protein
LARLIFKPLDFAVDNCPFSNQQLRKNLKSCKTLIFP